MRRGDWVDRPPPPRPTAHARKNRPVRQQANPAIVERKPGVETEPSSGASTSAQPGVALPACRRANEPSRYVSTFRSCCPSVQRCHSRAARANFVAHYLARREKSETAPGNATSIAAARPLRHQANPAIVERKPDLETEPSGYASTRPQPGFPLPMCRRANEPPSCASTLHWCCPPMRRSHSRATRTNLTAHSPTRCDEPEPRRKTGPQLPRRVQRASMRTQRLSRGNHIWKPCHRAAHRRARHRASPARCAVARTSRRATRPRIAVAARSSNDPTRRPRRPIMLRTVSLVA